MDTDEAVKSGRLNDTMGVELLIVRYSSGVNKTAMQVNRIENP